MAEDNLHIFGVRHHPGSARSLREGLERLKPDCLLIEGPPDAEEVLTLAMSEEMKPPVALMIYDLEKPHRCAFYPFAVFSPEWQAIQYGLGNNTPVRFMDLPQSIQIGLQAEAEAKFEAERQAEEQGAENHEEEDEETAIEEAALVLGPAELADALNLDPIGHLARAAGYSDSERWWEHIVEHRRDSAEIFSAVFEAMKALREAAIQSSLQRLEPESELRREAYMRQTIRSAQKEGFSRIAVVCGAWHAPALRDCSSAKEDAALLKGLPKRKVASTWIQWTYSRLAYASGYGAGIESPGWYDFLWHLRRRSAAGGDSADGQRESHQVAVHWLARVAALLREQDMDASSASIIEAARLAEALSAMRGRPLPGLPELNEAIQAVLCFGDNLPLRLISEKLIVSERLGQVPESTPMVPLAQDLAREQKRLRLPPEASLKQLDLDLRKPNDLDRSRLLHRLTLLEIPWGNRQEQRGSQKGTFHELWALQWNPEFAITLVEAGLWGNTIAAAAAGRVKHLADGAGELPKLTELLHSALWADLPEACERLIARLQEVAALASDAGHLMSALPPLANILRYGNVRQTDAAMVGGIVDGLIARICIGLPGACCSLNDEAAEDMFGRIEQAHAALGLLQKDEHTRAWHAVLRQLADSPSLHGLIAGRACRFLRDARQLDDLETARRFGLALSLANPPAQAAAWVDGFLRQSGLLLLHDSALWSVLDGWITQLTPDNFTAVLPFLRRTFSTFAGPERRQLGERVARDGAGAAMLAVSTSVDFDEDRANRALPLLAQLLGLQKEDKP